MKTVVVGAGVGGLSAAALLARHGHEVLVLERSAQAGGKLRQVRIGAQPFDAGPTVFTLRAVFEQLFDACGDDFAARVPTRRASVLARHAWDGGARLDLHADLDASVDAIGDFAGAPEARRYRAFCDRARGVHAALERPYLHAPRPGIPALLWRAGWRGLPGLARIAPFTTLWRALGDHFHDPRLRQLFGRYATYCGSSPFHAPATLMLVAHVEREGVWFIDGGMQRLAEALAALAQRQGARLRCDADVRTLAVERGRVAGVVLAGGERIAADAVVFNGDVAALAEGRLGPAAQRAQPRVPPRSLSALTWHQLARVDGDLPLHHHTVCFGSDYAAEFEALRQGRLPPDPTVYLCAQDRGDDADTAGPPRPERLMALVNAPARALQPEEIAPCQNAMLDRLRRCGLTLHDVTGPLTTAPQDFARLFPGTDGALYGRPMHSPWASFQRGGATPPRRLPGLYLAGGSVHPGPGLPMAALSGRLAAERLLADRRHASTRHWQPTAMPGGTSTR